MAAHRYWRLFITASQAGSNIAIGNLRFRSAVGGADITTGTAIFSVQQSGFPATNAFDNNVATAWASNNNIPAWIGRDFGSAFDLQEYVVQAWSDASFWNLVPTAWQLEWSDNNVIWEPDIRNGPPKSSVSSTGWVNSESRTFNWATPAAAYTAYKIDADALVGATDAGLSAASIRVAALSGAAPGALAISSLRVSTLAKMVTPRLKVYPQVIG